MLGTTPSWVQLPYCFQNNSSSCQRRQFVTITTFSQYQIPSCLIYVQQIETLPVTSAQLKIATNRDPTLSKVLRYTKKGWPAEVSDTLKPNWYRRAELSIEDDYILWGTRVIVLLKLRKEVLKELHQSCSHGSVSKELRRYGGQN